MSDQKSELLTIPERNTAELENDHNHEFMESTAWYAMHTWKKRASDFNRWQHNAKQASTAASTVGWIGGGLLFGVASALMTQRWPIGSKAGILVTGAMGMGIYAGWCAGGATGRSLLHLSGFCGQSADKSRINQKNWTLFYKDIIQREVYLKREKELWRRYKTFPTDFELSTGADISELPVHLRMIDPVVVPDSKTGVAIQCGHRIRINN